MVKVNKYDASIGHTLLDLSKRLEYFVAEEETRVQIPDLPLLYWHPLIKFGIKCHVCFRTPFHDADHTFTPCGECKLAWWCSPECADVFKDHHTSKHCADLCTVLAVDSVSIAYAVSRRVIRAIMLRSEHTQRVYTPPSSLLGWDDYQTRMIAYFGQRVQLAASEFVHIHPDAGKAIKLLATESASIPLTVLGALEKVFSDSNREGASQGMAEELLHYLPNLRTVTVAYIGPGLERDIFETEVGEHDSRNLACEDCASRGRRRFAIRRRLTYHEFAETEAYRANPADLVAGFNTGMGEVEKELWTPSIRLVLQRGVPALFTSYSQTEALHDMFFLIRLRAKFVATMEKNVWRGVIPTPSERHEHWGTNHYINNYLTIVNGNA
ncbi:hypothetical protein C8F01DRAFT_1274259 [Mycena amicta]|nr:hypothetical protein C8F01DRAFT_1274259 [Mycena amicta]